MANNELPIKLITLKKIADAIKHHQAKQNHIINVNIPVRELAKALRYGTVSTTAPVATEEIYKIQLQTLVDVADVVRDITGTMGEIAVKDLEGRILNLSTTLDTPQIEIVDPNIGGDEEDDGIRRLERPQIVILGGDIEEETPPEDKRVLDTPHIAIIDPDAAEEETPGIVLRPLDAPYITIRGIEGEGDGDDEQHEPIPLDQPQIYIVGGDVHEEEQKPDDVRQLTAPIIYIASPDATDTPEEPEVTQQLSAPTITIANPNAVDGEITTPTITPLAQPQIVLGWIIDDPFNPEIPTITALEKPTIIIDEFKDVSTNTPAILGVAILGRAILGKT